MEKIRGIWVSIYTNSFITTIIQGILLIIAAVILLTIGLKMIDGYFKIALLSKKNINKIKTIKKVVKNLYKIIVLFIFTTIFLDSILGVDTTSIITVAGVSGVAVGFASQNLIKDLVMGIMLLMEDNITIGDTIETNGYKGVVEDINLRTISLRDSNNVLHIIPNNIIKNFSNYSR